jgi:vancomycin resistance protein YoaR
MKIKQRIFKSGRIPFLLPLFGILAVGIPGIFFIWRSAVLDRTEKTALILDNVYIHGVSVGGQTMAEAADTLKFHFQPLLENKIIRVNDDGTQLTVFTFGDFSARYDFSEAIVQAWQYGREGAARERFKQIRDRTGENITHPPVFTFDESQVEAAAERLAEKLYTPPVNAAYKWENGIQVIPGREGRVLDTEAFTNQIRALLARQCEGSAEIIYRPQLPEYTEEELLFGAVEIGRYETAFPEGNAPRAANIALAAERVHNITLYPGDVFSASDLIGSSKPNNGYQRAVVIVNGKVVEDEGGGVCQVVSTLYNAVLFAELSVVERHNHSIPVTYADFGLDATIAGNYFDLKFKNDTPHPLLVTCEATHRSVAAALYGFERHPEDRRLEFIGELVEIIHPEPPVVRTETGLPAGREIITKDARDGYKFDVYKYIYKGSRAAGKEKINTTIYKPVRGEKIIYVKPN